MKHTKKNLFDKFSNLLSVFTTRENSNLAFHVGEDPLHVEINHEMLACSNGYDCNALIHMKQIHSDKVHVVTDDDSFHLPPTCDALVTNKKNIPLMVMVADCAPVLFYDPKNKTIAVAHAGRAGAFSNILTKVLQTMQDKFHAKVKDIYVSIGANISPCCYEVGQEIFEEAQAKGFSYAVHQKEGKYFLDINSILKTQLLACGILPEHLEIKDECTACNTEKYFSYRAEGKTGRFAGILMLK